MLQNNILLKYNINDSIGSFNIKVKLSGKIDYDTKTGYLYCKDAIFGNIGINLYKGYELGFADRNKIIKVHRIEEEVFDETSLESIVGKPLTFEHPKVMVDSTNVKNYISGTVLSKPVRVGDNMVGDLVIYDADLVDLVAPINEKTGERELSNEFRDLSLGYEAKLVKLNDKDDEYYQKDIIYNHLAVVKYGRQENATIVFDSKNNEIRKEFKNMAIFDFLKGKKVRPNEDGTITILDEEKVDEKEEVEVKKEKEVKDEDKPEKVVKDEDKEEKKEEVEVKVEKEKVVKDKAYFVKELQKAQSLPDGEIKATIIDELNQEFLSLFPKQVKDSKTIDVKIKPVNNGDEIIKQFGDSGQTKVVEINFDLLEQESKDYYDKLTNPYAHESFEDFEKNYKKEQFSGRSKINM